VAEHAGALAAALGTGPIRRVHVVGVGGAGMSGIATILASLGYEVSGSDRRPSATLERLAAAGVDVAVGHHPERVAGADLVTASTAVPDADPELVEAARLGVPLRRRAPLLAALAAMRRTVAVGGTKGKTTTTAMLVAILDAERPGTLSYLIGGDLPGRAGGASWREGGEWFVVEADESDRSFLCLRAEIAVVTNVEADHLDTYGSFGDLRAAFARFAAGARAAVVGLDSPGSAALAAELAGEGAAPVLTVSTEAAASLRAVGVHLGADSSSFELATASGPGPEAGGVTVELPVPGLHNVRNALAAIAAAGAVGVPAERAAAALAGFRPVGRRFERRGEWAGVCFVDDYAHLPSALHAVIATARVGAPQRLVAVFQPHLYTRTRDLATELGEALTGADLVVVTDVYPAREAPLPGVTGELVAKAARRHSPGLAVHYEPDRSRLASSVAGLLRPGDTCLSLGAGDITTLAAEVVALGAGE